jgi:hypothetical protein
MDEGRILRCILFKFTEALINLVTDGTPSAHVTTIRSHENLDPSKYGEVKSKYPLHPSFLEVIGSTEIRFLYRYKVS